MRTTWFGFVPKWVPLLCFWLVLAPPRAGAQCVELTAEIEVNQWSYWSFQDERDLASQTGEPAKSIFVKPFTVHCLVGTNTWLMDGDFMRNASVTRWFTGTNIVEFGRVTSSTPLEHVPPRWGPVLTSPPVGHEFTRVYDSSDGNPGRPVRVSDLMDFRGRACWLAFCSGPALQQQPHRLFPPSDLWKEVVSARSGFTDETTVFKDGLGLPKSVKLFSDPTHLVCQYQVRQSTNVLGWNIPLEFYLVQYQTGRHADTNIWEVEMTVKGRVTSIGAAPDLKIPAAVLAAAKQ